MRVSGQLNAPAALRPGKNAGTNSKEGWLSPRASLDGFDEEIMSCTYRGSYPEPSSPLTVTIPTALYRLLRVLGTFTIERKGNLP